MIYTLEDYLVTVRNGQWFGFENLNGDNANKIYANLVVHDGGSKPTEQECIDGVAQLQANYDAQDYARKRKSEYPSIEECVHAILDDTLTELQTKRAEVKAKYPK